MKYELLTFAGKRTIMTNNNITISGDPGSGKSSVTAILQEQLGYERVSVGLIQREIAASMNMSAVEFNRYMETHPEIDHECDRRVAELGQRQGIIFDSRMAWRFVPLSFKVFLTVEEQIAAKRIFGDTNRIGESFDDIGEAVSKIRERRDSERLRFKLQYDADLSDFSNYDLIVETSDSSPTKTAACILHNYYLHAEQKPFRRQWLGNWTESEEFRLIINL
ncbi:MAG: cytidylate kinase family protein [Tannerellaceae bacterium]|jgi:cytidylate kinase|nr:cytidylate kinase family protein [Tannerellaceae bacterium]